MSGSYLIGMEFKKGKKAWKRVKFSMTIRAAGTTFENWQERLQFLRQFKLEDLTVALERERGRYRVEYTGGVSDSVMEKYEPYLK